MPNHADFALDAPPVSWSTGARVEPTDGSAAAACTLATSPGRKGRRHSRCGLIKRLERHGRRNLVHGLLKPHLTTWVADNIAAPAGVTAAKLLDAPPLSDVAEMWLDTCMVGEEGAEDEDEAQPVVLAGHNAHAVDFPATYWSLVRDGLDAYELLTQAGVIGVLDTLKLAKQLNLPPAVLARLDETAAGNKSYSNSSLYKALLPKAPSFDAHRALPDATATASILGSKEMSALLRRANLGDALISLDQLVLKAHADYNKQFAEAGAARAPGARKQYVCRYCNGAELPYHATQRTCPKRLREMAAAAAE